MDEKAKLPGHGLVTYRQDTSACLSSKSNCLKIEANLYAKDKTAVSLHRKFISFKFNSLELSRNHFTENTHTSILVVYDTAKTFSVLNFHPVCEGTEKKRDFSVSFHTVTANIKLTRQTLTRKKEFREACMVSYYDSIHPKDG